MEVSNNTGWFFQCWGIKPVPPSESKKEGAYWVVNIYECMYLGIEDGYVSSCREPFDRLLRSVGAGRLRHSPMPCFLKGQFRGAPG